MKPFLILAIYLWTFDSMAQSKTQGAKETTLNARDGKLIVGKVMVNPTPTKLFLLKSIQKRDSANNYITTFYLGNKETVALEAAKVFMKFDKPVIAVTPSFSAAFNYINALAEDHLTYLFKAHPLNRDPGTVVVISFRIKSKERIVAEISGLDGALQ